jgi:alpha-L-fucosidase
VFNVSRSYQMNTTTTLALILWGALAAAQTPVADAAREQRIRWWREARFGMFIHWGLYAIPAGEWQGKPIPGIGEWIMNRARIPVREYEKLAGQFDPVKFNAEEWVQVAQDAGMKYLVITAKHHDGFALYGSKASKYNIVEATPFRRDPLKELAAACRKAGIRLGFYYSQTQDWYEPDAVGNDWDFPDESKKNFARYLEAKVKPQVRELLTGYGPLALIWYDTPRNISRQHSEELAALVHQLQPQCLVSGRVGHGVGDYDSAGDNQISVGRVPRDWETPVTLNDTWGYKKDDHNWKSPAILIRQLAQVASRGGNYLLNVGPTAEGIIPRPSVERLAEVGQWMKVNGEAIYGTSAGPFPYQHSWGVITTKPGRAYLHVFDWPGQTLSLGGVKTKVSRAWLLADPKRKALAVQQEHGERHSLRIALPAHVPDTRNTVVVLATAGALEVDTSLMQQPDRVLTLPAYLAEVHAGQQGAQLRFDSRGVVERWLRAEEWLSWDFKVHTPGSFEVALITSQQKYGSNWEGGHRVAVTVGGAKASGVVDDDGRLENPSNPYWPYVISTIGSLTLDKAGAHKLELKPESIAATKKLGLTLVAVRLTPRR